MDTALDNDVFFEDTCSMERVKLTVKSLPVGRDTNEAVEAWRGHAHYMRGSLTKTYLGQ